MTTDDFATRSRPNERGRRYPLAPIMRQRRYSIIFFLLLLGVIVFGWWLLHRNDNQPREHSVPVTITLARQQDVPVQLKSIGNVTPINSVAVKAHVSGQIMETHFREGQLVKAGDPLFTIDPRPLQAAVSQSQADVMSKQALVGQADAAITKDQALLVQAKANKQKDIAIATNAARETQRYLGLVRQGAVSMEQYEQYRTTLLSDQATVAADQAVIGNVQAAIRSDRANLMSARANLAASQAVLQNARVQLGYSEVTSPITGLAGNMQVLNGNLVRADQDTLVTVNQIAPIYVSLTVPEQQFNEVRAYAQSGTVTAQAFQPNAAAFPGYGRLVFANNQVDTTTGTVMLKVLFDNQTQRLWPGQFVNTVLTLAVTPNAVVVPAQAVQTGQTSPFVWVVRPDSTAHMQNVTTGQTVNGWTVITSGILPNQKVITDGQLQLSENSKVSISRMQGL